MTAGVAYDVRLGRLRIAVVLAALVVWLAAARPRPVDLAIGLPWVVAGEALRVWAAGHLRKSVELVTSGPYRFVRHPLYLGRLLVFTGIGLAARLPFEAHIAAIAFGWAVFFGYYLPRKERVEPPRLRGIHGARYDTYHRAVPALWPTRRPLPAGAAWSVRRFVANRETWMVAALTVVAAYLGGRAFGGS